MPLTQPGDPSVISGGAERQHSGGIGQDGMGEEKSSGGRKVGGEGRECGLQIHSFLSGRELEGEGLAEEMRELLGEDVCFNEKKMFFS